MLGGDPVVAGPLDVHGQRVRFELRQKVHRASSALHRSRDGHGASEALITGARRDIQTQDNRVASHSLFLPGYGLVDSQAQ